MVCVGDGDVLRMHESHVKHVRDAWSLPVITAVVDEMLAASIRRSPGVRTPKGREDLHVAAAAVGVVEGEEVSSDRRDGRYRYPEESHCPCSE